MQQFTTFDGQTIAYAVAGSGPPVLLLHGFASDHHGNWVAPGIVASLVAAGRHVLAPDARGHGASAKPHDPAAYGDNAMARDARALLDHLDLDAVDVVGYSMGAIVATRLVSDDRRARSLVLGGVGGRLVSGRLATRPSAIADALLAEDPRAITDPAARAFRRFADRTGADKMALAAMQRAPRRHTPGVREITVPTLVLVGDGDTLAGPPDELAAHIPGATARIVAGDHLSAMYDPAFSQAIVEFLVTVDV